MKYKIVLVPFPFNDFSVTKVRPAVCLSNTVGEYEYVVLAFISSQLHNAENSDIILEKNKRAFVATGLKVSSVVKLHRLVSIPKKLIQRELGVLPHHLKTDIDTKLKQLFNLN